jgi:anhydro-N-acetylmuramic acid kinase
MSSSNFYDGWNASLYRLQAESNPEPWRIMGLMSGTSLDGVDACLATVSLTETGGVAVSDLSLYSVEMPWHLKESLLAIQTGQPVTLEALMLLNKRLGHLFADTALEAMAQVGEDPDTLFCIASHGQTVYHSPPKGPYEGATLQLGEPSIIAEKTGVPVVADFRTRDMAAGGQGAPLVPFADVLLFQNAERACCVQNIGGIGNVTVLPKLGSGIEPFAFDTGPGNMLIDGAVSLLFGRPFDPFGGIASAGEVNEPMLAELMAHPFLAKLPPKSTGRETFGKAYLEPLLATYATLPKEDILATLTEFSAATIALAYEQFVIPIVPVTEVVLSGGGVHNRTLMSALRRRMRALKTDRQLDHRQRSVMDGVTVTTSDAYGIPSQAKEALAFGLMGWAARLGLPNHIPSCTGAGRLTILGKILPILNDGVS